MPSLTTISAVFASALTLASAAFNPASKTNVVYYWGQGSNQADLTTACSNPSVDIVVLGFVHIFPDQGKGGYPGTNFGNACGGATYKNNGVTTELLSDCPSINTGIKACHAAGKVVLLSLGGGFPHNGYLKSKASAEAFSDFLWGAFGPQTDAWVTAQKPRPFGDAFVDGFDFDIESSDFVDTPTDENGVALANPKSFGYNFMIDRLRTLYAAAKGDFYISGAPQCIIPDEHLAPAIAASHFDFLFVQLYNTDQCSARAAIQGTANPTLPAWSTIASKNPAVKIYLGLPASETASSKASYLLTTKEVYQLASQYFTQMPHFGGIMLWEATSAAGNLDGGCGKDYTWWMKEVLNEIAASKPFSSTCPVSSSSSSIASSTSSTISSSSSSSITSSTSSAISSSSSVYSSSSSSSVVSSSSSYVSSSSSSSYYISIPSSSNAFSHASASSTSAAPVLTSSTSSASSAPYGNYSTSSTTSSVYVHAVPASSTSSALYHNPYYSSSSSVEADPEVTSKYYVPSGSRFPVKPTLASSSSAYYDHPYDPPYVVTATVITTAYVDICPTGLTTISTTYTTKVYPHSTTPAVPDGWTTTVTVYNQKTITLTKPISQALAKPTVTTQYSSTEVKAVTLTIVPVPAKKPVYNDVSYVSYASSAGVAPSFPVKPVVQASSVPVKAVAESSSVAYPVAPSSPYKPVYGTAAPTGSWSKTSSGPITQYTGAANKLNVGAGVLVGLVGAVLAM